MMLRKLSLLFLFSILFTSCNLHEESEEKHSSENNLDTTLAIMSSNLFKYQNVQTYKIDTISWDGLNPCGLQGVDSVSFMKFFKGIASEYKNDIYNNRWFYSIDSSSDGTIRFSVLERKEDDHCHSYRYFITSSEGKILGDFELSSLCGDGSWTYYSYGEFKSHDRYLYTSLESELFGFDTISNNEIYQIDSSIYEIVIDSNSKIKSNRLFTSRYQVQY